MKLILLLTLLSTTISYGMEEATKAAVSPISFSFHEAAKKGDLEACKLHIQNSATVDAKDKFGYTPLHNAVANGHFPICELLIKHSATVDAKDNRDYTPYIRPQLMDTFKYVNYLLNIQQA